MIVGPCVLLIGEAATAVDYGDYVTNIVQNAPEPVVLPAINRDYSQSPTRGYTITLTGVQEDLEDGTLWRYLWDNFNTLEVPVTWSPLGDGAVYFSATIASIPDPSVGGAANQHGTFDITLSLVERPTIVEAPAPPAAGLVAEPVDEPEEVPAG